MTAPATPAGTPAATLADRFGALTSDQRVRLMRRLAETGRAREIPAVVPVRDGDGPVRLSPAQQDLWVYESLYPGTPALNLCAAYHFDQPVEAAHLETVLTRLQTDHDILRTRISTTATGEPLLAFPDDGPFVLEHEDLRGTGTTIAAAFRAFRARPFDLERERLIRARFVRVGEQRSTLMLSLHHIITDWWSFDVLQAEFAKAYNAVRAGAAPAPARPRVQYADFAGWQGELEESGVYDARLAFWRDYLADLPGPLDVTGRGAAAADRAAGATGGEDGIVQIPFHVRPPTARAVRALAKSRGASVYTVLMAAFAVLAHRVTGAPDMVLGTPVANRSAKGLDQVIGYVMNAVPTRWRIGHDSTFGDLLARFAADFPDLMANADLPVGRIVSATAPERRAGRSPLFQWVFMHLTQQPSITAVREFATPERIHTGGEHDLVGVVRDSGEGMDGSFEIRTDTFSPSAVTRWAECYLALLDLVTADPDVPLRDVDPVPAALRAALTAADQGPAAPEPTTLPALLARQAALTPGAPALDTPAGTLSYAELLDRTNRLAGRLAALGAGPGTFVALAMRRGSDWPAAALAVMRTGAACLPLDPDHPAERLRTILDSTRPVLVVAEPGAALPATGLPRLDLDAAAYTGEPHTGPHPGTGAPAYVIHTSGSTGTPKAVVVPHSGIAALTSTLTGRLGLGADSRVLQLGAPTFDISVGEICMALGSGGTLVLPPPGPLVGDDLARVLDERAVTVTLVPPSVLATVPEGRYPALRTVVTGAEACPADLAARWSAGRVHHNAYGPTEATVAATVSGPLTPDGTPPPLGEAVDGMAVRLLDDRLRPVPPGVTGELYLAAPHGLAHGYLGRPGQTAERFVPDPYGPPGTRMYRTGDLAWRDDDGTTHYAGRRDEQLKLRGLRIEPGEIESVLGTHPGVARAVAVVRDDGPGGRPRLVAYAVPRAGAPLDPAGLLAHAAAHLPAAMVPADAVVLDALPLTSGGKLDRAALPAPAARPAGAARAPGSATEKELCALFADVLGTEAGADDDFFRLGGDSIMAIQLAARACAAGLTLAPRDVFTLRTPARLADLARTLPAPEPDEDADDPGQDAGPLPLTPMMRWWLELGGCDGRFTQSMVFPAPPGVTTARVADAVAALVRRHDALRLRLAPGAAPDRALEPLTADEAVARARTVREELPAGADPAARAREVARTTVLAPEDGETLRATVLDAGPGRDGLLVLTVHHLAVDGFSWRVLGPELITLLTGGELAPPTTGFARWAHRTARDAARAEAELPYWRGQVDGPDARLREGRGSGGRRETVTVTLPAGLTHDAIVTLPNAFHCGPDAVLLTALATAAVRSRGHGTALLVHLEGHGRETLTGALDLSRAVGWFTTQYPVRLEPGPAGDDPAEALKRVKEQLRAVPSGGIGWGLLRHAADGPGTALAALPAPDVRFNYLGRWAGGDVSGGRLLDPAEEAVPLGHAVEIDAMARDHGGELLLETTFSYAAGVLTEDEVRGLADRWEAALAALVERAATGDVAVHTPSDFPLAGLTQDQLTTLVGGLDFGDDLDDDTDDTDEETYR